MATNAGLAAHLLRDAAKFFRALARDNAGLEDEMSDNAAVYEHVAALVLAAPNGEIYDPDGIYPAIDPELPSKNS